jgi:hypothetical protein
MIMKHRDRTTVSRTATVLLWLLVINLGIALGAGVYESRIVVPDWLVVDAVRQWNPDAALQDDTGRRFWVAVTTVPLTLLTLANLVAAWRAPRRLRRWWLATASIAFVDRAFTLGYFVPTMVRLMRAESTQETLSAALQWTQLNHLRHVIVLAALLGALRTFSLLYSSSTGLREETPRDASTN